MFGRLGYIVPLENFSFIWRRHHYRWRAANFDLYSALMVIEQCGFFSVPHLLRHGAYVYNGHLWSMIRDTHTYCRVFSSGAATTCFYDLGLRRLGFKHPTFRLRDERSNLLRHRRSRSYQYFLIIIIYQMVFPTPRDTEDQMSFNHTINIYFS